MVRPALPALGMGAIPEQLAVGLPSGSVRLESPVMRVEAGPRCVLRSLGRDARRTRRRRGNRRTGGSQAPGCQGSGISGCCDVRLLRGPPNPLLDEPILILDGDGHGPVITCACQAPPLRPGYPASRAWPWFPPPSLDPPLLPIADDEALHGGRPVAAGRLVRRRGRWVASSPNLSHRATRFRVMTRRRFPPEFDPSTRLRPGLYVCGDHRSTPHRFRARWSPAAAPRRPVLAPTLIAPSVGPCPSSNAAVRHASVQRVGRRHRRRPRT